MLYRGCENNQPLYEAVQAESFFDINSLVSMFSNISSVSVTHVCKHFFCTPTLLCSLHRLTFPHSQQLNLDGSINVDSSLTYTSDDFIPAATRSSFSNLSGTISSTGLNLGAITQLLNSTSLDALDLSSVATNLTTLASVFGALVRNQTDRYI